MGLTFFNAQRAREAAAKAVLDEVVVKPTSPSNEGEVVTPTPVEVEEPIEEVKPKKKRK